MNGLPRSGPAHISTLALQLASTLLGLAGTALVIVQAMFWIPRSHANVAVLILIACVPLIAAVAFTVVPRHAPESDALQYAWSAPMVWISLALPVALSILTLSLIGANGDFNSVAGLAVLLAANAGRNLRDMVRVILLHVGAHA